MDCVVIDSNRDTISTKNEMTYLNIEASFNVYKMNNKFTVKTIDGDLKYKCILSDLLENTITDKNGKTIAKFKMTMNDSRTAFDIKITSKNDNLEKVPYFQKNECINVNVQLGNKLNSQKYQIQYYNKATGETDIIELYDRSEINRNSNQYVLFDYKIYNGKEDNNAPLICDVSTPYSFEPVSTVNIQPGVEPLFVVILHICVYINNIIKFKKKSLTLALSIASMAANFL